MTYSEEIGARIHFFRKLKGLTLDELATSINKHKSTLSKYESGQITLDVESLKEIADALEVNVAQLLERSDSAKFTALPLSPHNPFHNTPLFYLYYFDGRVNRTVSSALRLSVEQSDGEEIRATLYMDVPDLKNYTGCRYYYSGTMFSHDMVTYFLLENQTIHVEKLSMLVIHSFCDSNRFWGSFMGLSPQPFGPMTAKMLFSKTIIPQEQIDSLGLKISKKEWRVYQRYNLMLLENNS